MWSCLEKYKDPNKKSNEIETLNKVKYTVDYYVNKSKLNG